MKTVDNADYKVIDELGWTPPSEFIAVVEIEDDESSTHTDYEQIQFDAFVEVAVQMFFGIVEDKYSNQDWHIRTIEMVNSLVDKDAKWTLDDVKDAVKEWVEETNNAVEASAKNGFEARQSGDYWEGEY
jgi:hypothetical protein